jgi:phage protein D
LASVDVRQPAIAVLVNGAMVAGVESVEINSDLHLGANRFHVGLAYGDYLDSAWSNIPLTVEVQLGLSGSWSSIILGDADSLDIDPIRGRIGLAGRDFTARFLQSQTQETFENSTSSAIATILASRRGLSADVTPTSTVVGRYFGNGRTFTALYQHSRVTSEWDILGWLAQNEGFDVWVDGSTLHFHPSVSPAITFSLAPSDCMELALSRRVDLAAGVSVQVNSWDCQRQTLSNATAQSSGTIGRGMNLVVVRPNLSMADAENLAQRVLTQTTQHERTVQLTMPANLTAEPRMLFNLVNTQTDFDGAYQVCEIERHFDVRTGFVQHLRARAVRWTSS